MGHTGKDVKRIPKTVRRLARDVCEACHGEGRLSAVQQEAARWEERQLAARHAKATFTAFAFGAFIGTLAQWVVFFVMLIVGRDPVASVAACVAPITALSVVLAWMWRSIMDD